MNKSVISLVCFFACLAVFIGCRVAPETVQQEQSLRADVDSAVARVKSQDPTIQRFFDDSYGYAILPKILKGAIIVGGGHGKGEVYEQNRLVGYCNMTQISGGISLGGEYYSEFIFFKDKMDLDKFEQGEYTFSAQMTAVAARSGVAAKADYKNGTAVFIMADTGLMADASLGGQKFNYVPYDVNQPLQP
ncbi:MAG: hypothetical protein ABFD79_16880 [Phycisphaerales bacterium]